MRRRKEGDGGKQTVESVRCNGRCGWNGWFSEPPNDLDYKSRGTVAITEGGFRYDRQNDDSVQRQEVHRLAGLGDSIVLRWLIRRKLDSEEKKLGESMDYLRYVVDASLGAFLRFASIMPFANARKRLPPDAWFVAQIVAAKNEDCGPCLQITVNLARQAGVDADLLRRAVDGDFDNLPDDLAEVARFSNSVVLAADDEELRAKLVARYGERGLIELAYAIASSRIPPTVKRSLGFAKNCKKVNIQV